jgi:CHAD domain-containing protein
VASGQSTELERELKFEAPLNTALPDLRDLVGRTERLPQRLFSTVYFDTEGMRLWKRGLTLRHRVERGEATGSWTLKLPSDSRGSALERTEMSWSGSRDTIPSSVVDIARGIIRREALREIVALETVRQRLTLRDHFDRALGEIDDDVVRILDGPRRGDRFRQVEFELAADEGDVVDQVVDRFAAARLSVGAEPKVAVSLGLSRATPGAGVELGQSSTLGDVYRVAVFDGLEQLLDHDWGLRRAAPDVTPEDVHKARVAARRLRSNLRTLRSVLDPVWTRHVLDDLKWIGSALGDIRDVDVLTGLLATAPQDLQARLSRDRAAAVERLMPKLISQRYLNLLDRLHAATGNPPVLSAREGDAASGGGGELRDLVGAEWRALGRRVRKSGSQPTNRQLHRIRIGAKRLRYAAELAEPVIGESGHRIAKAAEEVQTVLGQHHDAVAAEEWLRAQVLSGSQESIRDVSVSSAYAAGFLAAGEQQTQRRLRESWLRSWNALRRQAKALR